MCRKRIVARVVKNFYFHLLKTYTKMSNPQERWDAYVVAALNTCRTTIATMQTTITALEQRIGALADSDDTNVIKVRTGLNIQLTRLQRRIARLSSKRDVLGVRSYSQLNAEEQGFVDFIGTNTPDEVLQIGAQNPIDITKYYNLGIAASASITNVSALTEADFVEIANEVSMNLQ